MSSPTPPPPSSPNGFGSARPSHASNGGAGSGRTRLWLSRADEGAVESGDNFDALTDLFLGEVGRRRRDDRENSPPAAASPESRPMLRLAGLGPTDEAEPEPVEDAEPAKPAEPQPRREPLVECLVVGNLPVLASAWASQYVREVARASDCPVAFVRAQAGFVTLELVGETQAAEPSNVITVADLDAALHLAAQTTHRWVVRVDPADEIAAAGRGSMRLVTLITGPDDAARLGAYGTLKELSSRLPADASGPMVRVAVMSTSPEQADAAGRKVVETVRQHLGRDVQHAVCSARIAASRPARLLFNGKLDCPVSAVLERLEIAVQGGPAVGGAGAATAAPVPAALDRAEPIAEPAVEAAAVQSPVTSRASAAPMTPPVAPAVSVPITPVAEPEIEELEAEEPVAVPAAAAPTPTSSPTRVSPMMPWSEVQVEAKPIEPVRAEPLTAEALIASTVDADAASPGRVETVVRSGLIDRVAAVPPRRDTVSGQVDDVALWSAGAGPADGGSPRLTTLVAGLTASAVQCPYAEQVDVALDCAGRVHLLVRSADEGDEDKSLAALMVASAWLDAHAAMLRSVDARVASARGGTRVLHLFTATPKRSRRLLETDVRVHVLAQVDVGGRTGWCCVDLN